MIATQTPPEKKRGYNSETNSPSIYIVHAFPHEAFAGRISWSEVNRGSKIQLHDYK